MLMTHTNHSVHIRGSIPPRHALQAKAAIWDLVDEVDSSANIKELYTALLDPIAMSRVANRHIKVRTAGPIRQPARLPVWLLCACGPRQPAHPSEQCPPARFCPPAPLPALLPPCLPSCLPACPPRSYGPAGH